MRLNTTYYGNIHYFCSYNKNITHLIILEQIRFCYNKLNITEIAYWNFKKLQGTGKHYLVYQFSDKIWSWNFH